MGGSTSNHPDMGAEHDTLLPEKRAGSSLSETGGSVGDVTLSKSSDEEHAETRDVLCGVRLGFDGVFAVLSSTFILCVGISCVAEEAMYKHLPEFDYFWTVAFVELLTFAGMSVLGVLFFPPENNASSENASSLRQVIQNRKVPIRLYVVQATVMAIYAAVAKIAYKYLNYATGTVLRSTKLIFVMAVSVVWLKRRYTAWEYGSAVTMIIAVACFGLGEEAAGAHTENHWLGYVLSVLSLGLAAVQTNMADNAMRDYGASTLENMLFVNSLGLVVVTAVACYVDGMDAVRFFRNTPHALDLLAARSLTFYAGALTFTELTRYVFPTHHIPPTDCPYETDTFFFIVSDTRARRPPRRSPPRGKA